MLEISKKYFTELLPYKQVIHCSRKDELVNALHCFDYGLPSKATKDDYIWALDNTMHEHPQKLLEPLCWDSLMIIKEIIEAGKGQFVKRPHWQYHRDVQQCLHVVTYYDKEDGTDWMAMPGDLHEALAGVIDEHLKSKTAQMHQLLDPWILGLTNLYGFCPDRLLFETLDKHHVVPEGFCTKEEILAMVQRHIGKFGNTLYYCFDPGQAPRPYHECKEDLLLLPSYNLNMDEKESNHFFDCLASDGIFHHQYRTFSREEILAAGSVTPDFLFPEATALKQYLADEGNSPEWIASEMTRYWLTNQLDDKTNQKAHLTFKSKTQQRLYDDFLKHLSKWVCRGYGDTEVEGEFDASMAEFDQFFKKQMDAYEKLTDEPLEMLPAVTSHPTVKPEGGTDVRVRFVKKRACEITIDAEDGQYFVCYVIDTGEANRCVIARWGQVFEFIMERYLDRNGQIDLTPAFRKKYRTLSRFMSNGLEQKPDATYLLKAGFDGQPREWFVMRRLPEFEWEHIVLAGEQFLLAIPGMMDEMNQLYDDCFDLYDEIDRSDAKSVKVDMKALFA